MLTKINLKELILDGISEIRIRESVLFSWVFHLLIPIMFSAFLISIGVQFDDSFISIIISSISLFSGLLFSVIFVAIGNYSNKRKSLANNSNEEVKNYLNRYKKFTSNITTLILFSVVLAIFIIISLLFFYIINKTTVNFLQNIISLENLSFSMKSATLIIIQTLSSILIFNYLLSIFMIVKEIYSMMYDSINSEL